MTNRRSGMLPAVVGPVSFGVAAAVGARTVRDYRHRDEPISALAAEGSPAAPVMIAGFLVLAASTWRLAGALESTRVPRSVVTMMRATAVSTALAGVARQSDRSCPVRFLGDENVTLSDDLHVLFSGVAFSAWIAMPLVTAARGRALRPPDRRRSLALGAGALGGWIWMSALIRRDSEKWGGLAQRLTVGSSLAFYPLLAIAARD